MAEVPDATSGNTASGHDPSYSYQRTARDGGKPSMLTRLHPHLMKRHQWKAAFDSFPVGLSILEISQRMGCSYRLAAAWVKVFGYKYKNWHPYKWTEAKKKRQWKVDWSKVPWGCTNAQIARAYGVSREIVRKRRIMHEQGR